MKNGKRLNQKLVDSFTVAFKRDQDSRIDSNYADINKNDKKNAELLRWMFENYGFPDLQKIGLWNGDFLCPPAPCYFIWPIMKSITHI